MGLRLGLFLGATLLWVPVSWAQVRYPSLEDARRAIRCSLIYAIAAREAPDIRIRDANLLVRKLVLELGSMSAGTQLTLSWVDELQKEIPTLQGESLLELNDDCKRLIQEYRETLGYLREKQSK